MKECDILEGQNILGPSYIFSGGQDPQHPRIYVPGRPTPPKVNLSQQLELSCWQRETKAAETIIFGPVRFRVLRRIGYCNFRLEAIKR